MIYIIGVSGSGKTTVGRILSGKTSIPFFDADDFHPPGNIQKMKEGRALTDEDRQGWLEELNKLAIEQMNLRGAIIACSALKEKYRVTLSNGIKSANWVFLKGDYPLIYERIAKRTGHYMPARLLQSQFDILEEPGYGLHIDSSNAPEVIAETIVEYFQLG